MATPSAKRIAEWLQINRWEATALKKLMQEVGQRQPEVDAVMKAANAYMEAHGIEAIRGDYYVDGYWQDIVALYVNTGDTYNATLLYETEPERFVLTTWGDWVEAKQRKYRIM